MVNYDDLVLNFRQVNIARQIPVGAGLADLELYQVPWGREYFIDCINLNCQNTNNLGGTWFSISIMQETGNPLNPLVGAPDWIARGGDERLVFYYLGAGLRNTVHRHYWPPAWVDQGLWLYATVSAQDSSYFQVHGWERVKV